VDFRLTPEQELLRDSARSLLQKECPTSLVRAHIDDPSAADPLWKHLREWTELGRGPFVDLCLFLEETGAVLAPGPFFATAALYLPLIDALDAGIDAAAVGTVALPDHDLVIEADRADVVVRLTSSGEVIIHERPPVHRVPTIDSTRHLCELTAAHAPTIASIDADTRRRLQSRAYVALAAELMGTVRWLFDTTLAYAKVREQFDRPIGSFQAVQHKLANMALLKDQAWSAVYYAAMAVDAGDADMHRAAHVAKLLAGEAAELNGKDAIQIHGGIGYTWEHDLHLYLRRAFASQYLLGTGDWHRDRLATLLLD
jgi:alkylation response protein AidB-like acyl-CoA dehydrogenase